MKEHWTRWLYVALAIALMPLALAVSPAPITTHAQSGSRTFPETGKTVQGRFLQYWDTHGGLAQQGFPISEEMQEVSDTDGKTYTVQYFERAVFEAHPENQPPNDVLLSLLGVFLYNQKYPGPGGAPGQTTSSDANARLFSETGHKVGGLFLDYWQQHGGLAQQGYPISDEFDEVSALDGKTYRVQYFERAVFELHPENQPPFNVLLSQLGTFRYRQKYQQPAPTPASTTTPTAAPVNPTATIPSAPTQPPVAQPTNTPAVSYDCSGIPANENADVSPNCVQASGDVSVTVEIVCHNLKPGEAIRFEFTDPDGSFSQANDFPRGADAQGNFRYRMLYGGRTPDNTPIQVRYGVYKNVVIGKTSGNRATAYVKVIPPQP